jgi:hypothetical protein
MDQSDSSLTVGEGRNWTFELGYFSSDPLNPDRLNRPVDAQLLGYHTMGVARLARASVTHRFNSDWSANLFTRYNLEESAIEEVGGYLQYELDCISFRMNTGYIPAITRLDGSQRPVDYRVSFNIWVKALQSDYVEKMRGW